MEQILPLAEQLGKAIAASAQAAGLRAASRELDKHEDVKKLLADYRAQVRKFNELEAANKTIEVDDKHKLRELHEKLVATEVFKKYTSAQVEYVDLMRRVSDAMRKQLVDTEE